jgi:abequosyltransferase
LGRNPVLIGRLFIDFIKAMQHRLLTIAIPTFNRPHFLDRQLTWLATSIKGFESECEIIISDDGSTDNTNNIINKWQPVFGNTIFRLNANSQNISPVRNIAHCISLATGKYVWVVGDDDLQEQTLGYVVTNLKDNPELSLLIINYSIYYAPKNKLVCDRYFPIEREQVRSDGKIFLEHLIAWMQAAHGLGFITALIYRTEDVNAAISKWPSSIYYFEAPGYWSGFCGVRGSVKISKDVYLQYNCGMNSMPNDKKWFGHHYSDLPAIYVHLIKAGYNKKLFTNLILKHFKESNLKVILGALRRCPLMSIKIIVSYLALVGVSAWNTIFLRSHMGVNTLKLREN